MDATLKQIQPPLVNRFFKGKMKMFLMDYPCSGMSHNAAPNDLVLVIESAYNLYQRALQDAGNSEIWVITISIGMAVFASILPRITRQPDGIICVNGLMSMRRTITKLAWPIGKLFHYGIGNDLNTARLISQHLKKNVKFFWYQATQDELIDVENVRHAIHRWQDQGLNVKYHFSDDGDHNDYLFKDVLEWVETKLKEPKECSIAYTLHFKNFGTEPPSYSFSQIDQVPDYYGEGSTKKLAKNIIDIIKRLDPILKKKFPGRSCITIQGNPNCDIEFRFVMATPNPGRAPNLPDLFAVSNDQKDPTRKDLSKAQKGLYYIMPIDLKYIRITQYKDPSFYINYSNQYYPSDSEMGSMKTFISDAASENVKNSLFLVCNQEPAHGIPYDDWNYGYLNASREQYDYDMNNLIAFLRKEYDIALPTAYYPLAFYLLI